MGKMRLYSNICLLSVSWPCMASLYYRHNSIASVFFLGLGIIKSCISRCLSGIKMKLFLQEWVRNPSETDSIKSQISSKTSSGKKDSTKDAIKDTTSDSQVNSCFPYKWPPARLTLNIYFYLFLY